MTPRKTYVNGQLNYSSIYNIWGEIPPITFGNTAWPLDGTCINNDGLNLPLLDPICQCDILFAKVVSHSPMLHLICQYCTSFANIVPHLPMLHLVCQRAPSFADKKPDLPISILSIANTTTTFAKKTFKIFLEHPKGYHIKKIASTRLHSINIDSLFFFYKSSSHPLKNWA